VNEQERITAHLLDICARARPGFTLRDVVSRVIHERPDLIHDFAHAWNNLIHDKRIRMRQRGRPCTYEIAHEDAPQSAGGGALGMQYP
jgi:hypothetical protein